MSAPTDPAGESVALEALLLARARLYALFHKLFGAAPDAAVLEALLGGATADAVDEYAEDDETMRGFGRFLSDLAAAEGRATLLEAARDEHVRVLVGPGALPALPWEAPHRSGEPTVSRRAPWPCAPRIGRAACSLGSCSACPTTTWRSNARSWRARRGSRSRS